MGCADKPVEALVLLRVARMGSRSTRDRPTEKVPRPDPAKNSSRSRPDPGLLQNGARALQTPRWAQEAHPCVVPGIKAGIVDRQSSAGDSGAEGQGVTTGGFLLLMLLAIAGLMAWKMARSLRARTSERHWLPKELQHAQLAFAEKT